MPKIYFISLLLTGSFAGDNWDHCGRGSSAVRDHLWYCQWTGVAEAPYTKHHNQVQRMHILSLVDVDNQFFKDYEELFFSDN